MQLNNLFLRNPLYYVDMVIHLGLNKNHQKILEEQAVWLDYKLFY